jgi:hypothetical protein
LKVSHKEKWLASQDTKATNSNFFYQCNMNKTNATKTNDLLALDSPSLSAIWEAFFVKPSPDVWSHCSESEVSALQERCESHWVTKVSLLLRSFKFRVPVAGPTPYGWSVVLDIAAKLSPLHNTPHAHKYAMQILKRSAGATAYCNAIKGIGRELRLIDKEIFRAIDWEEEKERGRRMAPLRPPGWAEYYYRKVPSPIAPNSDGTEDANETIPSILGER